jgi:outer membrane protein assembly factor BamB
MRLFLLTCGAAVLAMMVPLGANAADWPQFRGPNHDGTTPQKINTHWAGGGPPVIWQIPLGASFGTYSVSGDHAFIFTMKGEEEETCFGLDARNGQVRWSRGIDQTIHDREGGDGPRSTPAFVDGKVYVLGTYLKLACLDANDGKILWIHDLMREFNGARLGWGNAASPVVDGNLVFVCAGGKGQSLIAFNKDTGAVAWKTQDDKPTHASPVPASILGMRQVIFFTQKGLVSVKPESGQVLWRQEFPYNVSTAASPVVCGEDIVYCTAGYGSGSGAFKITRSGDAFTSTQLWHKHGNKIVNQWSTPVYKDGYLYGLYGFKEFNTEPLKCIDVKTGQEKWAREGFGQGQVIMVAGNLLVQGDQGQIVLVQATPDGYREISRCQPLTGSKCWTEPAVANGRLYVRSQLGGACLDVSPK